MEEKEPKSSKAILTFGLLFFSSAILTVLLFIISTKNPDFVSKARFTFALTSAVGVAFMIYIKEFRATGDWKEIPIAFRFIWWSIFVGNALNFIEYIVTLYTGGVSFL